ncbi:MAG: sulfatase-like hydrolase/transferase, partial [Novosphingobium sp.]|nr:sulfatase-like hydrolase/transferase [Novosphingobium sp.]
FDKFYGFMAADTDNWNPTLVDGVTPVARPKDPDYHLSEDLAQRAIAMIRQRDARDPERPFFMYWATGAAHAPHHAPADWIARFRGKFDMGWDKAREQILKQQIKQGIVAKGTKLAPRPDVIKAWDALTPEQQKLYARQMEVFAASLSHADAQFGKILDALEASGELDNTIVVIVSDNGASAEGGLEGLFNEAAVTAGSLPDVNDNMRFYDNWGGPQTFPHYANGWAVAGNTPLRYYKQVAHEGGARVPFVIAWPKGIASRGEIRSQFVHVTDIAPTVLDAAGVPLAERVNNFAQSPMEGESVAGTFTGASAPDKARGQYVELYGNKGLWQDGWQIVTTHRYKTWDWNTASTFDEPWELYNLRKDLGQTTDLAGMHPERVASMAKLYAEQAARYNVNPQHNLSDTAAENFAKGAANFKRRGGKWSYPGPVSNLTQAVAPPVNARGFTFTAELDGAAAGATGPIFSYGGQMGGIALYLRNGKPEFIVNDIHATSMTVAAGESIGTEIELVVDRRPGMSRQGDDFTVSISSNGKLLVRKAFTFTLPAYMGIPETFGVGTDPGSPVMAGYHPGTPFPGEIANATFQFSGEAASNPLGH